MPKYLKKRDEDMDYDPRTDHRAEERTQTARAKERSRQRSPLITQTELRMFLALERAYEGLRDDLKDLTGDDWATLEAILDEGVIEVLLEMVGKPFHV